MLRKRLINSNFFMQSMTINGLLPYSNFFSVNNIITQYAHNYCINFFNELFVRFNDINIQINKNNPKFVT